MTTKAVLQVERFMFIGEHTSAWVYVSTITGVGHTVVYRVGQGQDEKVAVQYCRNDEVLNQFLDDLDFQAGGGVL